MDEFDPSWINRDFEEIDEKLPSACRVIVMKGIDYRQFIDKEEGDLKNLSKEAQQDLTDILSVMREQFDCFVEMTADEIDEALEKVLIGCELVQMTEDGLLDENNGVFSLSSEGKSCQDLIIQMEDLEEEDVLE